MSACKTGCGTSTEDLFCPACNEEWKGSGEYRRAARQNPSIIPGPSDFRALADFCNRVRAERRPEVSRES